MSDSVGMFEHADHAVARGQHGYCTDDVARLLIAIMREPSPGAALHALARISFRFLDDAEGVSGRIRNRRSIDGRWHGRRGVEDCWGRSVWAFGTAARLAPDMWMRSAAMSCFDRATQQRSSHRRAMAFAALGAAEVLAVEPRHLRARQLLSDAIVSAGAVSSDAAWPWPEPRLSYANAAIAESLIAAGSLLDRPEVLADGLLLLRWLLDRQTFDGHLSPVPVGGAGRDDLRPAFDQQPIEIAALADACARAESVTGDASWRVGVMMAIVWFEGDNDLGVALGDPITGGGYDGLTPHGANLNQGAESTLALITTLQHRAAQRDGALVSQ
ncbi:MAG: glycosyltransferase [Ilumatobacteraceae bacterium]